MQTLQYDALENLVDIDNAEMDSARILSSPLSSSSPCPIWFVLRLHLVKGNESTKVERQKAAFHAIVELALYIRRIRRHPRWSETVSLVMWRRLLTSAMMTRALRSGDPLIASLATITASSQTTPLHILIDYSGMKVTKELVMVLSDELLMRVRDDVTASRPPCLVIGLRFAKCRLQSLELQLIKSVLVPFVSSPASMFYVDRMLGRLDISHNGFGHRDLETLASVIRETSKIEELRMENVLARAATNESVAAFQQVLEAVFSVKGNATSLPLRLSLAHNALDARYYKKLAYALQEKSRPLASLSLATTLSLTNSTDREECWQALVHISFTTRMSRPACDLDLSGNPLFVCDVKSFQMAYDHYRVKCIESALLENDIVVQCRLYRSTENTTSIETGTILQMIQESDVLFNIQIHGTNETIIVPMSSLIDPFVVHERTTTTLVSCRWTSIRMDRMTSMQSFQEAVVPWLMMVGNSLHSLSLHQMVAVHSALPLVFRACPLLNSLDLSGCRLYDTTALWQGIQQYPRKLVYLNLSGNMIGAAGMEQLEVLCTSRETMTMLHLRHLVLTQNHIGTTGLMSLSRLLHIQRQLRVIELDAMTEDPAAEYIVQMRTVNREHQHSLIGYDPLDSCIKQALLQVLFRRQQQGYRSIDSHVITMIFTFASTIVYRRLIWK